MNQLKNQFKKQQQSYLTSLFFSAVEAIPWGTCHIIKMNNKALFGSLAFELIFEVGERVFFFSGTKRVQIQKL